MPQVIAPRSGLEVAHAHDHALASTEDASWRLSRLATWTVSACAVHCVLTPIAAGVLPLLGVAFLQSPWFEWSLVAIAALLGGAGFWLSYSRIHHNARPLQTFAIGLAWLIATHSLLESFAVVHGAAAVAGAVIILIAGRMNHSMVHACGECHGHCH